MESSDKKLVAEIKKLKKELEKLNHDYYVKNESLVTDEVYDAKHRKLRNLENKLNINDVSSPTKKVGTNIDRTPFKKVEHEEKMLSLDNAFNLQELKHFMKGIEKEEMDPDYFCELKIDGVSISLIYENGKFTQGITRGDGQTGEDVTKSLKLVSNLPLIIKEKKRVTFRGEIYFALNDFKNANENLLAKGKEPYKNPRNAVSGLLRTIDTEQIFGSAKLMLAVYEVVEKSELNLKSQKQLFDFLIFNDVPILNNFKMLKSEKLMKFVEKAILNREKYNYQIDGVVIKVNSFRIREEVGWTSKFPKWAIAYKLPSEIVETKLENIFVTIGRSGKVTYNARLTTVMLGGTAVSFASLHNYSWIQKKDIRVNDIVRVKKAGDIIPEVLGVVLEKRKPQTKKFLEILNCPTCKSNLQRLGSDVDQMCLNKNCKDRITKSIAHFVSRTAMNISDISQNIIEFLYEKGWLTRIGDIFYLHQYFDLWKNEKGFGEKSIHKILSQIKKAFVNCDASKFLFGLGLNHVGKVVSRKIISNVGGFKELTNVSMEKLEKIPDIGERIAKSLIDFFSNDGNKRFLSEIENNISFERIKKNNSKLLLKGMKIAITGTLSKPRSYFEKIIIENGGSVSSGISKKTNYLLCGSNAGSKITKAKELKVHAISEESFLKLVT